MTNSASNGTAMDSIVRFQTNIAQRLTLKLAKGVAKESKNYGGVQYWHPLLPSGSVYLQPFVEGKLEELGVGNGDSVEICKREVAGGRIEWQVAKLEPSGCTPTAPVAPAQRTVDGTRNGTVTRPQVTPPVKLPIDQAMTKFLVLAGRSTREAERVLGAEGGSVRFDSRDVCALATTVLIQAAREGWLTWISDPVVSSQLSVVSPDAAPAEAPLPPSPKLTPPAAAVANEKIAALTAEAQRKPVLPVTEQPWRNRGEMRKMFQQLKERVGDTAYFSELEVLGVSKPEEIMYLNDLMTCYNRLAMMAVERAS